jgi:hypothetical protein
LYHSERNLKDAIAQAQSDPYLSSDIDRQKYLKKIQKRLGETQAKLASTEQEYNDQINNPSGLRATNFVRKAQELKDDIAKFNNDYAGTKLSDHFNQTSGVSPVLNQLSEKKALAERVKKQIKFAKNNPDFYTDDEIKQLESMYADMKKTYHEDQKAIADYQQQVKDKQSTINHNQRIQNFRNQFQDAVDEFNRLQYDSNNIDANANPQLYQQNRALAQAKLAEVTKFINDIHSDPSKQHMAAELQIATLSGNTSTTITDADGKHTLSPEAVQKIISKITKRRNALNQVQNIDIESSQHVSQTETITSHQVKKPVFAGPVNAQGYTTETETETYDYVPSMHTLKDEEMHEYIGLTPEDVKFIAEKNDEIILKHSKQMDIYREKKAQ